MVITNSWWFLLLKGIILILVGAYFVFDPKSAAITMAMYLGMLLIAGGGLAFVNLFRVREEYKADWSSYLVPTILVINGLILLLLPKYALIFFALAIGVWIVFDGIGQLNTGDEIRNLDRRLSRMLIVMGLLSLLLGIVIFMRPEGLIVFLSICFGILITIAGVFLVGLAISTRA